MYISPLFSYSEIQGEEMEQVKINFFGPLIAVILLITFLVGFVILKKRNTLSTNQSKLLLLSFSSTVPQVTGFALCNHPFTYIQAADRRLCFMPDLS